jgi:error-prone DNA polymerase
MTANMEATLATNFNPVYPAFNHPSPPREARNLRRPRTPAPPCTPNSKTTTNFSFLRGASHVEELFARAAVLGIPALGITDRGTLAGIVRAHQRGEETNVRCIIGTRLDLTDGPSVLVYPTAQPAYASLCRLLTLGKSRAGKGACELAWNDLAAAGTA